MLLCEHISAAQPPLGRKPERDRMFLMPYRVLVKLCHKCQRRKWARMGTAVTD